jgi:hypothetical protein
MNFVNKYYSIAEAGRDGFCKRSISLCCTGKIKTSGGYIWKFAE